MKTNLSMPSLLKLSRTRNTLYIRVLIFKNLLSNLIKKINNNFHSLIWYYSNISALLWDAWKGDEVRHGGQNCFPASRNEAVENFLRYSIALSKMRLPRRERYASRLNREKEERNPLGQRNREKGGCARFFKFGSKRGVDIFWILVLILERHLSVRF